MAAVPIVNGSFESPAVGDGSTFGPTGWTVSGGDSNGYNATTSNYVLTPTATDGAQLAYGNTGMLSQVLTTNYAANTRYVLSVDIGDRVDTPLAGYSLELWAGATQLATVNQTTFPSVNNGWITASLTHTSPSSVAAGQDLQIRLVAGGVQVNWDNVRLEASPSVNDAVDDGITNLTSGTRIPLQNATALFSQGGFPVSNLIDNVSTNGNTAGWANNGLADNTAVFETVNNVNPAGAQTLLTFTMHSGGYGTHTLGKFRLAATNDNRANFADGAASGGDVTAAWTVVTPLRVTSSNGTTTFTINPDGSVLVGGGIAEDEVYTIQVVTSLANITGFRLEALEDASFPSNGPGRAANGNFVVKEFVVAETKNVIFTDSLTAVPAIPVLANDVGAGLTVAPAKGLSAQNAYVSVNPGNTTISYDPTKSQTLRSAPAGQLVFDTFTYTTTNGSVTDTATVTVLVRTAGDPAGNQAPTAVPDFPAAWTTTEDASLVVADAITGQVSYIVNAGQTGNQQHPYNLGMDFDVNTTVTITHLGVFDEGSDGLTRPLIATLYNRADSTIVAQLNFPVGATGTLIGGSRFLALPSPIVLPAGFVGVISAEGYGAGEQNGNGMGIPWSTNSAGGALTFVGGGRYSLAPGVYPANGDGGPANRYAAGTFLFNVGTTPDLTSNDFDTDPGDMVVGAQAGVVTSAMGASVTINANGSFTYNPTGAAALQALPQGATVTDSFNYNITDLSAAVGTGQAFVTVTGVNDAPTADAGPATYTISEGQSLVLAGSANDIDTGTVLTVQWDLNNDGIFGDAGVTTLNGTVTWAQLQALVPAINDGPSTRTISVRVSDGIAAPVIDTATLTVNNAAPSASVDSGPQDLAAGQVGTFDFSATDPGAADNAGAFTFTIDWGDGTVETGISSPDRFLTGQTHAYTDYGSYNIRVRATDRDGLQGAYSTAYQVDVSPVVIDGDTIYIGGDSSLADTFTVSVLRNGALQVLWKVGNTTTRLGPYSTTADTRLVINGLGGNDRLLASANTLYPVEFHGGDGNDSIAGSGASDTLYGDDGNDTISAGKGDDSLFGGEGNDSLDGGAGLDRMEGDGGNDRMNGAAGDDIMLGGEGNDSVVGGDGNDILLGNAGNDNLGGAGGNDVLVGGDDNDMLNGNAGNDVMIGGNGADQLVAGTGEDILLGGTSTYDDDEVALAAIIADWSTTDDYDTRVDTLLFGNFDFANVTVDDGSVDKLTGQSGLDWFLRSVLPGQGDKADLQFAERQNDG